MTYTVRPSRASLPENQFRFTLPDGSEYSIPKLKFLKPEVAVEINRDLAAGMTKFFADYLPEVLKKLDDIEQLEDLMEAWQEASNSTEGQISLGESQASAIS